MLLYIIVGIMGLILYYNGKKLAETNPDLGDLQLHPNILNLIGGIISLTIGFIKLISNLAQ